MAKERSKFKYRARTAEDVRARANQSGSGREGFLLDSVKTWTPKAGEHTVRILPPTWEDAKHFGLEIWAHYNIGPNEGAFLCLEKMKQEKCAIDEEQHRAMRAEEDDLASELKARKRVGVWMIDRDNEREGPQLWMMPWSVDRDICSLAIDKKTGEVYNLDHPEKGYDISFKREGDGLKTKYIGIQIDRKPSPASDDEETLAEWIEFVTENPIPDMLVYAEPEALEELVGEGLTVGSAARRRRKDKDDDDKPKRRGRGRDDDEDEKPKRRKSRDDDDEDEKPKRKSRDDDEDDEDEKPKKRRGVRDEDDEDEKPKRRKGRDDDEDDDDEDEAPKKKKKARDDDEDDEDEKPKRRKAKDDDEDEEDDDDDTPFKKKKARDDDEDDENEKPKKRKKDDDDDDDEDDKPSKKSRPKLGKKDDDDDEDDEDDEDDAPKSKAKSRLARLKKGTR